MNALLDTHTLLWWLEGSQRLPARHAEVIDRAVADAGAVPLRLSAISLWEVATLHRLGRIRLSLPLRDWLEYAVSPPLVRLCPLTPAVAAESAALGEALPGDPTDRLIVATSRVHGCTLLTSDLRIRDAGVVPVV